MFTLLEELRIEALERKLQEKLDVRSGSTVKGHYRHYANGHTVWIDEHERSAHTIARDWKPGY